MNDHAPAPIRSALRPALLALIVFALAFGVGLWQLARSNRPHELTAAPYVAVLLALTSGLALFGLARLRSAWRAREERPLTLGHGLLAVLLVLLAALSAVLFVSAVSTSIEVFAD